MPAVLRVMLLDGIVGEVYFWVEGVDIEVVGRGADVALFVPVCPGDSEEIGHQHVVPDVELTLVVKQGTIDVELHDEGAAL